MFNVVLCFRDNVVHKIECADSLEVAQSTLNEIARQKGVTNTYTYMSKSNDLVFVGNFDNFNYAFIEEKENN